MEMQDSLTIANAQRSPVPAAILRPEIRLLSALGEEAACEDPDFFGIELGLQGRFDDRVLVSALASLRGDAPIPNDGAIYPKGAGSSTGSSDFTLEEIDLSSLAGARRTDALCRLKRKLNVQDGAAFGALLVRLDQHDARLLLKPRSQSERCSQADDLLRNFGQAYRVELSAREIELPHICHRLRSTFRDWPDTRRTAKIGGDVRGRRLDETILDRISSQAAADPCAVAIAGLDSEISYADLEEQSNRLARLLISRGIGPEKIVAVLMDRSAQFVVTILAILKAGGAYCPLDEDLPDARLKLMVADQGPALVLTERRHRERLIGIHGGAAPPIALDDERLADEIAAQRPDPIEPEERVGPLVCNGLAYIIFTSGSSGIPKAVAVAHRQLLSLADTIEHCYGVGKADRVAQFSAPAFTQHIEEILPTLAVGATVVPVFSTDDHKITTLVSLCSQRRIDIVMLTPSLLRALSAGDLAGVNRLVCTGEAFGQDLISVWSDGRALFNEYGSSETTVCATVAKIEGGDTPTIGTTVPETTAFIVDERLELLPDGQTGELLIGGPQVARGYLGQAGLTAEKFIADPFGADPGGRLYKTGDLARRRADGHLEFLGRVDRQVKVRGIRVELEEIEAEILSCPGVADALVVAREVDGDVRLDAFVVPKDADNQREAGNTSAVSGIASPEMEFGLFYFGSDVPTGQSSDNSRYDLILKASELADIAGLAAVWTPERHFSEFGGQYPSPSVISAAVAARTKTIGIRAGSVVLPINHPIRVAEDWALIDQISGGRVGVSFASGWHPRDFVLMPGAFVDRKKRLQSDIDTVKRLWRGETIEFESEGENHPIAIRPRPLQEEIPIWLTAAGSPDTFRIAGEIGANLLTFTAVSSLQVLADKIKIYREAFLRANPGRRPHVSLMMHTFLAETTDSAMDAVEGPLRAYLSQATELMVSAQKAETFAGVNTEGATEALIENALQQFIGSRGLIGTPTNVINQVDELKRIGVDEVACLIDFGVPAEQVVEHLSYLFELNELAIRKSRNSSASSRGAQKAGSVMDAELLRVALAKKLPASVIPNTFTILKELPKTPSGKVARSELPLDVGTQEEAIGHEGTSSHNGLGDMAVESKQNFELLVAEAFMEVLQPYQDLSAAEGDRTKDRADEIDGSSNFFDLGGHSLLAVKLASLITERSGKELPLRVIFEKPTVSGISQALIDGDSGADHELLVPFGMPSSESVVTLFCIHPAHGGVEPYISLAGPLGKQVNLVGIRARGYAPGEEFFSDYDAQCEAYADAIRTTQPDGPLHFLGWSYGGVVAHDLAHRFSFEGRSVESVTILDAVEPDNWNNTLDGREIPEPAANFEDWLDGVVLRFAEQEGIPAPGFNTRDEKIAFLACSTKQALFGVADTPVDPDTMERIARVWHLHERFLVQRPRSSYFPGKTLVVRGLESQKKFQSPTLGWEAVSRQSFGVDVAEKHLRLLNATVAETIAHEVRGLILPAT